MAYLFTGFICLKSIELKDLPLFSIFNWEQKQITRTRNHQNMFLFSTAVSFSNLREKMEYRRLLLLVGICILVGTFLQEEVHTFYNRRHRRRGSILKRKRAFHPIGKSQQRGEFLKVRSEVNPKNIAKEIKLPLITRLSLNPIIFLF